MIESAENYPLHCNHVSSLLFLKWYFIEAVSTLTHLVTVFSGPSGCFHLDQETSGVSAWPLLQVQLCIMSFHLMSRPSSQNLCCAPLISPEFYLPFISRVGICHLLCFFKNFSNKGSGKATTSDRLTTSATLALSALQNDGMTRNNN